MRVAVRRQFHLLYSPPNSTPVAAPRSGLNRSDHPAFRVRILAQRPGDAQDLRGIILIAFITCLPSGVQCST
jgi:hypothetical protein